MNLSPQQKFMIEQLEWEHTMRSIFAARIDRVPLGHRHLLVELSFGGRALDSYMFLEKEMPLFRKACKFERDPLIVVCKTDRSFVNVHLDSATVTEAQIHQFRVLMKKRLGAMDHVDMMAYKRPDDKKEPYWLPMREHKTGELGQLNPRILFVNPTGQGWDATVIA